MVFDKLKYAIEEVLNNYSDRYWWHMRLEHRIIGPVQQRVYGNDGIGVMNEDWDTLLVIDACRADIFEDTVADDDYNEYRVVTSKGSATPEWMERTFKGKEFGDTVYVSANPWVSKIAPESFHEVYNIWLDDYDIEEGELADAETLNELDIGREASIPAHKVNEKVREAKREHPEKRIIAHYFQPHAPYIGNADGSLKETPSSRHPGQPLAAGELDKDVVWEEYQENLEYVLSHTDELREELPGKTIVTSDHGEMFGEWLKPFPVRGYAHPVGLRSPELTQVPWASSLNGDRVTITDDGTTSVEVDNAAVDERLRDLGYKV